VTTLGDQPLIDPLKLPPPHEVLRALVHLAFTDLGPELGISAMRVSIAFVMCIAVSVPLGVAMGAFESVNRWVDPIISPLRFTPMNAFVPIFIMWFGIDETEKIAFLFFATVVFLLPSWSTRFARCPKSWCRPHRRSARRSGSSSRRCWCRGAAADLRHFRVMNGIAWGYILLAEMVNSRRGIGHLFDAAVALEQVRRDPRAHPRRRPRRPGERSRHPQHQRAALPLERDRCLTRNRFLRSSTSRTSSSATPIGRGTRCRRCRT